MPGPHFRDRRDAGRRLARLLAPFKMQHPVVLALSRGGVPVGYEVARALDATLDVVVPQKIDLPDQPTRDVGATVAEEAREIERRLMLYRGHTRAPEVQGRTVLLVDDGLATGLTAHTAIRYVRRLEPRRIVFAAPVCASRSLTHIRDDVDEVACALEPRDLQAVESWYADFTPTSDDEVLALLERMRQPGLGDAVRIPLDTGEELSAELSVDPHAKAVVVFAHGSESSRRSPRNTKTAEAMREAGYTTLLLDLLTEAEIREDEATRMHRVDVTLLAERLMAAIDWLAREPQTRGEPILLHGSTTGTATALIAAAGRPHAVNAIVSRGGRPDLAGAALDDVCAPTLLIVSGDDAETLRLNEEAAARLRAHHEIRIVEGAGPQFDAPGTLDEAVRQATAWFNQNMLHAKPGTHPKRRP